MSSPQTEAGRCPLHPDAALRPAMRAQDRFWGFPGTFSYERCSDCASWVLNPRPTPESIGPYYEAYYTPKQMAHVRELYARRPARRVGFINRARARSYLRGLRRLEGAKTPASYRLLDVGCGLGGFARFVREESGASVRGVDFSEACRDFAREIHGVRVDIGELEAQDYPEGRFDLVTAWHILEHVYDPPRELAEMARITRPGGWLTVETPTPGALGPLFRGRWLYLMPPTHLFHYRPQTLCRLIEDAGFEVVHVERPWMPGELAGSLMFLCGLRGFVPKLFGPDRPLGQRMLSWAFIAQMVFDMPLTFLLSRLGVSGHLRIYARRRG